MKIIYLEQRLRRLRSRKKRAQLFLDFNGKCAICSCNLIKWHADHKIPFVLTKNTDYVNMQPLCPTCNLKKGKKVLSPKNRSYYESLNLGIHVDIAPFRIGQKGAFNCIVEKVIDRSPTISIVLPTRYGKSDVIRASAIELIERGVASGVLIAAPCKFLRDQLTYKKKIDEMAVRYTIATNRPICYDVLDNFRFPIFQNQEYFVSLTTQMLSTNADQICAYIKQYIDNTGKAFLVYIDESHSQSDANTWGAVVPKINAAGGIVILCTATPYRDDGKKIPGFNCIIANQREKMRSVPRQHEDPNKYWVDIYKDIEGDLRLEADYEYTFKSAWAEGNVICKVSRAEFDVIVKIPNGKSNDDMKEIRISEMTRPECRKYFGRVVRDPKVIQGGVKKLIDRLKDYRRYEPSAQAIIFCGNDVDEEDDGHAKQIATEISCQNAEFKVVIATSKQDDADQLIKQFGEGKGDILIVKQMASLGMDIPPIKIGLDLSAVRTLAAFVQRMMRTATMWGKNEVSHLIIPSDVNGLALWNGFIEENGGNMTAHNATLLESIEKDKEEKESTPKKLEVLRTEDVVFSDNSGVGSSGNIDYNDFARPLIMCQPKIQAILTDHETVMLGKQLGKEALSRLKLASNKAMEPTRDITEQRLLLRNKIKRLTSDIANKKFHYGKNKEEWILERKKCVNRAKKAVDVDPRTKMESITNIEILTKINNFLENELNNSTITV